MLYQQPQSGPVDLDLSGPALGTISALLPVFKSNDMVLSAPVIDNFSGVVIAPDRFEFGSSAAYFGYTDAKSAFFRNSVLTKVLRFRLRSTANGYIYTSDGRLTVGVGVEGITSGELGVSWYDGSFRQISFVPTAGVDYTLVVVATASGVSLYANGRLIGSTASGAIVYSGGRGTVYGYVNFFSLAGAVFDLHFSSYSTVAMPSAIALQVSRNPWILLLDPDEDDDLLLATGGASPDVTVAVTGQAATVSAGTLRASTAKALTGQSIAASRGTLAVAVSKALTGQFGTVARGTLSPSTALTLAGASATTQQGNVSSDNNVTVALSGQAISAALGNLAISSTVAMSGAAASISQGAFIAGVCPRLTGAGLAATLGNLSPATSIGLLGQGSAIAQGTMGVVGDVTVSLSGQSMTVSQGWMTILSAITGGRAGFEMVSMEPSWKRAIRLRYEAKQHVTLDRKKRKRAEFLEKLAAKAVLSEKTDDQIEKRIDSLLSEWVELAPKLELKPVAEVPPEDAYRAFMARVVEKIKRLEDEDDEIAAEMLLLS